MERDWLPIEFILVNKLLSFGKIDDDIYYILSDEIRKYRNRNLVDILEINTLPLNGMNIYQMLYELDQLHNNYNTYSVQTILRCYLIDTMASFITSQDTSVLPYNIIIDAYMSIRNIADIDTDLYHLDVWAFYILIENAGVDIIDLFTNEITRIYYSRLSRRYHICNKNIHLFARNYSRL